MMTKKALTMILGAGLLLSSCGTYTATGAYTGSQFGHVIGSAVGGINGGWRGHEVGSIIGTVGGAVAGAAIGSAVDRSQQRKFERQQAEQQGRSTGGARGGKAQRGHDSRDGAYGSYDSGYDPHGRGDDRIDFGGGMGASGIEIRNIEIVESRRDGMLTRGEELTIVFEVMNHNDRSIRNVRPLVEEATGNRHVHISRGLSVDRIEAHQGVRYTARLLADRGLRRGNIVLRIGVAEGQRVIDSQNYEYNIPTAKTPR